MKVAFFETKEWERGYMREGLEGMELVFEQAGRAPQDIAKIQKDAEWFSSFILPVLDVAMLSTFPAMKSKTYMQNRGAGHPARKRKDNAEALRRRDSRRRERLTTEVAERPRR
jgi:hypothetical protein